MNIQHEETGTTGQFYIGEASQPAAAMTYQKRMEGVLTIDHTEVSDALRGQNAGYQLVQAAVDYARQHHLKLQAWCPFTASVFKKKADEYADVIYQGE